ncbi:MAG: Crp/Fnr family transcriptional regulator [Rhodobiaceae bacterium]|nr:Crp/Fnr family transcriptional regulator [Rhodobiaceae bacterium]
MNIATFTPSACTKCETCIIHHRAVCRAAGPHVLAEFNTISRLRHFERGQTIMAKGDEATIVGNVVEGIVKLENDAADGTLQIVGLLYPSDFFGRVFADNVRFTYEAATDVTLCCMDRLAFEGILARHPEIEHELLVATLDELDAMRDWVALNNCRTTMERVAALLYTLARRSTNQTCSEREATPHPIISIPISRQDVAAYLGTTRETLSRNIQTLVRKGVVNMLDPNHLELVDEAALYKYAGEPDEDLLHLEAGNPDCPDLADESLTDIVSHFTGRD